MEHVFEIINDITGREVIKPWTILVDYQVLKTGEYKWKIANVSTPSNYEDSDILDAIPELLESLGERGKVRVGLIVVSNKLVDTKEFKDMNERYKGDIKPSALHDYVTSNEFRILFYDPEY